MWNIPTLSTEPVANSPLATLIVALAVLLVMLGIVAYLILLERKVAAWIQDRIGPNRAGPLGLFQPIADITKMFLKEEFTPARADRWLYLLAPLWVVVPAMIAVAVVPLAGVAQIGPWRVDLQIARVDVGLLYVLAAGSLGVYGVVLGGWAANSKYSFLGALRSTAQMLSYEVPLGLTLLSIVLVAGTLRLETIISQQGHLWWGVWPAWTVFTQPLAFLIVLTCLLAESNRLPFDLPEAEQELVGGYHTEYSSMRFGMFMLAEYAHLLIGLTVVVVLFLGGWHLPGLSADQTAWYWALAKLAALLGKVGVLMFLVMQIRWTLPRFRFDQLMRLAWTVWVPAALELLMVNGVLLWAQAALPWRTVGNVAVFAAVLAVAGIVRSPVTGRQRMLQRAGDAE